MTTTSHTWPIPVFGLAALAAGALASTAYDPAANFLKEGGPVETLSAVLLILASLLALLAKRWAPGLLIAFLAMRELDLDKTALSNGILKLRTYTGDAPLSDKLIGGLVIVAILTALGLCLRRMPRLIAGLRAREGWALSLAIAVGLVVVAKTLDGLGRKLADIGIVIARETDQMASVFEEVLELGFAVCVLIAVLRYRRV